MKSWLKQCAQDRILRFGSLVMFLKCHALNAVAWWSFSKTTPGDAAQAVVTTCRIPGLTRDVRTGASMLESVLDTVRLLVRQISFGYPPSFYYVGSKRNCYLPYLLIQNILTFLFEVDNGYALIDSIWNISVKHLH